MKFQYFFEDLLIEARYSSDEKFDWIASKMESWLFDKMYAVPNMLMSQRWAPKFKDYVKNNTNEPVETEAQLVMALDNIDGFLQSLPKRDSQEVIKQISLSFPDIAAKISRFGKSETPGKRGRPFGSKNKTSKPKNVEVGIDVIKPEPKIIPTQTSEPSEPKRQGRPKLYDDGLTGGERAKYRREGPAMIKSLEAKAESLDNEVNLMISRIKKIMADVEKRKKFFGQE